MTISSDYYPPISILKQGEGDPPEPAEPNSKETETFYLPIYVVTAVFGGIFIFGPLLVRKGPNRPITRCCIMLTAFCLWLFWVTIYIAQMNPLLGPRMQNSTVAWVGHAWGKNAKELGALSED